jgi:methane monooxygenase PmoA-like
MLLTARGVIMDRRRFLAGVGMAAMGMIHEGSAEAQPDGVSVRMEQGNLAVSHGSRPVLVYRHKPEPGPPGTGPLFTRGGYIHPVHAPCGVIVTDDFPSDHLHQRGVFFAWTKTTVTLDGTELHPDFWNLGSGTGRIRSTQVNRGLPSDGSAVFRTDHVWEARRGEAWEEVMTETWRVVLHRPRFTNSADPKAAYVFDLTSRQRPKVALELPEYRYGGMAVRGARAWMDRNSGWQVLTSEGKDRSSADASRGRWADMSGLVDGKEAGIALLEHPSNPRTPNPLRVPPELPYVVFTPPRGGALTLEAGKEHVFRYRLVAHNGRADREMLEALWKEFSG